MWLSVHGDKGRTHRVMCQRVKRQKKNLTLRESYRHDAPEDRSGLSPEDELHIAGICDHHERSVEEAQLERLRPEALEYVEDGQVDEVTAAAEDLEDIAEQRETYACIRAKREPMGKLFF